MEYLDRPFMVGDTRTSLPAGLNPPAPGPKPEWLRKPLVHGNSLVRQAVRRNRLVTVCEEARCPNRHECWAHHRTATFMVLGEVCTRNCRFCSVRSGRPAPPDPGEPERVARAVVELDLDFVVVTMVSRDDLEDGGASHVAATVRAIHAGRPGCRVEVLVSDFRGNRSAIETLLASRPDVVGHNLETVRRLTPMVRSVASYERSLEVLRLVREVWPEAITKSALMVGMGETMDEVIEAMEDLRAAQVDLLAIGQYLQPTRRHVPVQRYWPPDEFTQLAREAHRRGFVRCVAGPWVRSSYRADELYAAAVRWRRLRGSGAGPTRSAEHEGPGGAHGPEGAECGHGRVAGEDDPAQRSGSQP